MYLKIFSYITLLILAMGLSACHDDPNPNDGKTPDEVGMVHLKSLSVDVTNAENIFNSSVGSRASEISLADFTVEIRRTSNNALIKKWAFNDMPEIFELNVGDYKAIVYNTVSTDADFDTPYFVGESTFTIEENKVTDIDKVVCKLTNIKVSIRYTKELKDLLEDDTNVDVSVAASKLTFHHTEERSGYYKGAGASNILVAHFKGTVNGHLEEHDFTLPNVAPGQHRIITYSIKNPGPGPGDETGTVDPSTIHIDVEVENEDLTVEVDNREPIIDNPDEPGKEDPKEGGGDDPTPPTPDENTIEITALAPLSFDKPNNVQDEDYYKENPAIVTIVAPKGISHFYVKIDSQNQEFLNVLKEPDVNVPTYFDLTDPGEFNDTFKGFKFPTKDEVKNQTNVDFNLSDLLFLLSLYPDSEYYFTITIQDNDGKELSKTLTMKS